MKTKLVSLLFIFLISFSSYSQSESPYELDWKTDGTWLGVSLTLNAVGFWAIQNKEALTEAELNALSKDDVFAMDRWSAGYHSKRADDISYYPFFGSFAAPFVMMLSDDAQRSHAAQISVLLIETMATTGAVYTMTAGFIDRPRPLVYNEDLPLGERREGGAQRSFIAGHTSATAAASFFVAKIFNDFHPDSRFKPYVWTAAALVPAWVGYLRLKGGKHFLSDNIIGYGVGALSGILIPELHKKENSSFSLTPAVGSHYQGLSFRYSF